MVYVNSKKYACESCIKGHRSSSCHHNDRPLFEIKKKGRPVSQCEKCREARQERRIHAKCMCETEKGAIAVGAAGDGVKKKGKRFIPSIPSLPNGLKDALKASSSPYAEVNVPRQPVDALLNPCHCKDVYNCKCRPRVDSGISWGTRPRKPVDPAIFSDGLSALALVAACCSPATSPTANYSSVARKEPPPALSSGSSSTQPVHVPPSHISGKSQMRSDGPGKRKRSPRSSPVPQGELSDIGLYRSIAPAPPETWSTSSASYPHAPALPSIPASSDAGTSSFEAHSVNASDSTHCCCGTRCECAGCRLHSPTPDLEPSWVDDPAEAGPSTVYSVDEHSANCTEDCPTCIDYDGGVELPLLNSMSCPPPKTQALAPPYLKAFLARAASLPTPPAHTRSSLDPTNVVVYPAGLFKRPRKASQSVGPVEDERPRAFGLVQIPKLEECCGGRCGCAEDTCGCEDRCDGCCMEGVDDKESSETSVTSTSRLSPSISFARGTESSISRTISTTEGVVASSCCACP